MHALQELPYDDVARKPDIKMHELINFDPEQFNSPFSPRHIVDFMNDLVYNIETFRRVCNTDITNDF